MKTKQIVIGLIVLVVVIGLLTVGRFTGTTVTGLWNDTNIKCLVQGHQNLAQHIHPRLEIVENGVSLPISSNIGVSGTCLAEIHTHESDGTIHVESTDAHKTFTLTDFFAVWGESIERNGVLPTISIDGVSVSSIEDVTFADGQSISLIYGEGGEEHSDTEEHTEGDTHE